MANKIPNRQAICDTLLNAAKTDKDIVVLCSDSRGSASLTKFADTYPEQFVEMGIAEQDLVSVAAGLASCGKKAFAASPACFLSTRSYEQAKIDCAYSNTNVTLIGISGGVSYGALGSLLNPLVGISVAIEVDGRAGLDVVANHAEDGGKLILALGNELVHTGLEVVECLGHSGIEHDLGAGAVGA